MEKTVELNAQPRDKIGTKKATRLRQAGLIPGVVYGHQAEPLPIAVSAHDLGLIVHKGHRLLELRMPDRSEQVLIKDLQYDHLGRSIIHVDMMRVSLTEVVKVEVPVVLKGVAKGTHEGGIVEVHSDKIEIACQVTAIPELIDVWIDDLGLGQSIFARDIKLPAGAKLVSPPELLIASCRMVAEAKTTEQLQMETPAAPEVIREAKKDKQEEQTEQQD